jgi:hypothetical protein
LRGNKRLIGESIIGQSTLALSSIHRTPEYVLSFGTATNAWSVTATYRVIATCSLGDADDHQRDKPGSPDSDDDVPNDEPGGVGEVFI